MEQPEIKQAEEWLVYMLSCADGTIYTGITNNLSLRIAKHNAGKGAKYTRSRTPVKLLASWKCADKSSASSLEHTYKKLTRKAKEALLVQKREGSTE
jgi:putative endonuclease